MSVRGAERKALTDTLRDLEPCPWCEGSAASCEWCGRHQSWRVVTWHAKGCPAIVPRSWHQRKADTYLSAVLRMHGWPVTADDMCAAHVRSEI